VATNPDLLEAGRGCEAGVRCSAIADAEAGKKKISFVMKVPLMFQKEAKVRSKLAALFLCLYKGAMEV